MSPEEVLEHVRRRPFDPFVIHMTDGESFEVRHPEMIAVSKRDVMLAKGFSEESRLPESFVFCDPLHIIRVEPTPRRRPKGPSNGTGKSKH